MDFRKRFAGEGRKGMEERGEREGENGSLTTCVGALRLEPDSSTVANKIAKEGVDYPRLP